MKKIFISLLIVVMLLSVGVFVSCSGGEKGDSEKQTEKSDGEDN